MAESGTERDLSLSPYPSLHPNLFYIKIFIATSEELLKMLEKGEMLQPGAHGSKEGFIVPFVSEISMGVALYSNASICVATSCWCTS